MRWPYEPRSGTAAMDLYSGPNLVLLTTTRTMNNNNDDNADTESSNDQTRLSSLESLIRAGSIDGSAAILRFRGFYRRNVVDV